MSPLNTENNTRNCPKVTFTATNVLATLFAVLVTVIATVETTGFIHVGKNTPRKCLSSDEEFESLYRYLNRSESNEVSIQDWNWKDSRVTKRCSDDETETFNLNLTKDGFLIVQDVYYPPQDFCMKEKEKTAQMCKEASRSIYFKCCPENEIWDIESSSCKKSPIPFRPKLVLENEESLQPFQILYSTTNLSAVERLSSKPLVCPDGYDLKTFAPEPCISNTDFFTSMSWSSLFPENVVTPDPTNSIGHRNENETVTCPHTKYKSTCRFHLTQAGIMYETFSGLFHRRAEWKLLPHDLYCVDGFLNNSLCYLIDTSTDNNILQEKCINSMKDILFFCEPSGTLVSREEKYSPEKAYCLASIWLSTCPLLITSAVANFVIIQKNVHGWTLSCYLMSMFFVNICSAILALEDKSFGCRIFDFCIKFLYLSTLCWMTSINFGLWKTFRLTLPKPVEPRRFAFNCIFSVGFPIIIVMISYMVGKGSNCENQYCALYSHDTIPYYSGPVILLVLINLGLFIRTSLTIAGLRSETSFLHKETPGNNGNLESFRLFTKLFLMTGSIWLIRVVLLFLQLKGLYFTWYGVILEATFSIPEAAFSIMVLLHTEFKKWAWNKSPSLSRKLSGLIPCFKYTPTVSLELGNSKSFHSVNNTINTTKSPTTSAR